MTEPTDNPPDLVSAPDPFRATEQLVPGGFDPPTGPPVAAGPYPLPPPPPVAGSVSGSPKARPWWGMGDVLLVVPVTLVALVFGMIVMVLMAVVDGSFDLVTAFAITTPMIVVSTLIQQAAWVGWPLIVSKWKGLGPASDWGLVFKPVDVGTGLGVAMIGLAASGLASAGMSRLVGLDDDALATNTGLLVDAKGSPWLFGMLFIAVVGAPWSEELLFRGLVLRAVGKRFGVVVGGVVSLVLFTIVHLPDSGDPAGFAVLWSAIATLGLVMTVAAIKTERLAAPIIAHSVINMVGSAAALGYLDFLESM